MDTINREPASQSTPQPAAVVEVCQICHEPVPAGAYFCPNCGHPLHAKPPGSLQRISVYLISFFLPPFGLWYAWKYIKAGDKTSKTVGIIAILLTVVSFVAAIFVWQWFVAYVNQSFNQSLNQLNGFGF